MTTKQQQVSLLQQGYAMKIFHFDDFPFREIKEVMLDKTPYITIAETLETSPSRITGVLNKTFRTSTDFIKKYLALFNLEMILLKDDSIYSNNLDIAHLITNEWRVAKDLGLSQSYFYNTKENYRIDIYLDILEYYGLELAITQKGEKEND